MDTGLSESQLLVACLWPLTGQLSQYISHRCDLALAQTSCFFPISLIVIPLLGCMASIDGFLSCSTS